MDWKGLLGLFEARPELCWPHDEITKGSEGDLDELWDNDSPAKWPHLPMTLPIQRLLLHSAERKDRITLKWCNDHNLTGNNQLTCLRKYRGIVWVVRPALKIISEPAETIKIRAEGKVGGERQFAPETWRWKCFEWWNSKIRKGRAQNEAELQMTEWDMRHKEADRDSSASEAIESGRPRHKERKRKRKEEHSTGC